MSPPQKVHDLVEVFDRNADDYLSAHFNEAMLRQQFVNPLFACLGWDMDNEQGYAEAYKDVVHEAAIKIGGATKAPDYSFRIGGTPKFYLEAKKPSVNVKDDPAPAFQLRRYAWSARMPLSILTTFREFAVYDCRVKPVQTDKASAARILYLRCDEFAAAWDEKIAGVFSREAVLKGSFDKFADSKKAKRGTAAVDAAFLDEIEKWREQLAKNLALRNPDLSSRELNFAVQITIDRIIFLRMCEDRGVESYGQLLALQNGAAVYGRLKELFQKADDRYNSGLFHFHKEKDRAEAPDELTPQLQIDDLVLKSIFRGLYYPDSPYEFSVLPVEILGHVYEQFLGKVIRLTAAHQAKIDTKPEVKKAGGVYYTPSYIVDYIVGHTVGRLLEGKTPKEAARLTVLDPACGSGSFLVGAYRHLLEWHLKRYLEEGPEKHSKEVFQAAGGVWRLTTAEKKRILLNNVYGVDIDPQAVEVTKLSLLLVVLEGESQETIETQRKRYNERALPDLAGNIKCGNSLIGPDFYEGERAALLDEEERYRINVFDWNAAFPKVMKAGGFDAVIGNPPYIRIQTMQDTSPEQVGFLHAHYAAAGSGNYDIYVVFVEKGLTLLNGQGLLGFILPSKFFTTDYGERLRGLITQGNAVAEVIDFGHAQVFEGATTYTCLLFLSATPCQLMSYAKVLIPASLAAGPVPLRAMDSAAFTQAPWTFSTDAAKALADKVSQNSAALKDLPARIGRGSSSGADQVFMLRTHGDKLFTREGNEIDIERGILRTPIYATDFGRYMFRPDSNEAIIFPYEMTLRGYALLSESDMRSRFPKAYKYLESRKKELDLRKQFRIWYGFSAPRNLDVHDKADMLVPLLADRGLYCRLPSAATAYCLMASGGFSITVDAGAEVSPDYVLGLLNSRLLFWRLRSISNIFRGGWITCTKQYVETLPIRIAGVSDAAGRGRHDRMVQLVEHMLSLHQQLAAAKAPHDKTVLQAQIDATDRQIDRLVYDLYGLTEEEVRIVEGGTAT